jgi:hypothetical protein
MRHSVILVIFLVLSITFQIANGSSVCGGDCSEERQDKAAPSSITFSFVVNTTESTGLLFLFLSVFATFNLVWPFVRYIYVFYIDRWVSKAKKAVDEVAARLSERISDAGRKLSEQARV